MYLKLVFQELVVHFYINKPSTAKKRKLILRKITIPKGDLNHIDKFKGLKKVSPTLILMDIT